MSHKTITIIGGGNLGVAIAEGIVSGKIFNPKDVTVTRRNCEKIKYLEEKGINISNENTSVIGDSKYILFAVKPYQIDQIIKEILPNLDKNRHVLISVMTGVSVQDLRDMVGSQFPIFRAMPNTAIGIGESMTCICGENYEDNDLQLISDIFNQLGRSIIIDESLMDAATVLGACGTAYAMRYIRACIQGGIEIGFDAATATVIAAQTVKGAADLLLQKGTHPEQEIDKVTTPKGCTIAGLNEMEHRGFSSSLIKGIATSFYKIKHDM